MEGRFGVDGAVTGASRWQGWVFRRVWTSAERACMLTLSRKILVDHDTFCNLLELDYIRSNPNDYIRSRCLSCGGILPTNPFCLFVLSGYSLYLFCLVILTLVSRCSTHLSCLFVLSTLSSILALSCQLAHMARDRSDLILLIKHPYSQEVRYIYSLPRLN